MNALINSVTFECKPLMSHSSPRFPIRRAPWELWSVYAILHEFVCQLKALEKMSASQEHDITLQLPTRCQLLHWSTMIIQEACSTWQITEGSSWPLCSKTTAQQKKLEFVWMFLRLRARWSAKYIIKSQTRPNCLFATKRHKYIPWTFFLFLLFLPFFSIFPSPICGPASACPLPLSLSLSHIGSLWLKRSGTD